MAKRLSFTDSHCHLDFDAFKGNLPQLLIECQQANINNIVIPTIGPKNWQQALALVEQHNASPISLFPCLGLHPWFLNDLPATCLTDLASLVAENLTKLIAIGEAGIDGVIDKEQNNLAQQIAIFDGQLQLAKRFQLPIIVHHRRSHQHIVPLLKKYKLQNAGIIHAFSGSYQQACQYIDLGFKLGIGGTITYPRAEKTIKAIKRLPLDSLVLETDAPSMPLYGFQGQNNSPLRLLDVFNALSALRPEPKADLAAALENNIRTILPKIVN